MSIHVDQVRAALRRHAHYLPDILRDDLARKFVQDGIAHENDSGPVVLGHTHVSASTSNIDKLDKLAAAMADPHRSVPARFAVNMLRRAGVDLGNVADATKLSHAMRERGLDTDDRLAIKVALRKAGVLN